MEANCRIHAHAVLIPTGEYPIGDDSIPNASPHHRRHLNEFWIDAQPVSWAQYEVFVAGGGYGDESLWADVDGNPFLNERPSSVDSHHRDLLGQVRSAADRNRMASVRERPVTGLSWYEAWVVARFYGARLPFEIEWEAAMTAPSSACADSLTSSNAVGSFQEWTADNFTPRYWRADFARVGVPWVVSGAGHAVVRGAAPEDLYHHVCFRMGSEPGTRHARRTFRRVWDASPTDAQVLGNWRS